MSGLNWLATMSTVAGSLQLNLPGGMRSDAAGNCKVDTGAQARASQPPATVCQLPVCAQLTCSAWRLQPALRLKTLGCLVLEPWAWRTPEFGTGFEAQTWLLPPLVSIGWRRTSSNPSITLPCCLARGLNINQSPSGRSHSHTTRFSRLWTPPSNY